MFESFATSAPSLGIYRMIFASYLLLFAMPSVRWVSAVPDAFFTPPVGPLQLIHSTPQEWVVTLLSLALAVCTVALLVGYRTRVASAATGVLLIMVSGFAYAASSGKINHDLILLIVVPIVMSASGWGEALSVDRLRRADGERRVVHHWPVSLLALFIGFMFFTAALPKAASGWLDPSAQATYGYVLHQHYASTGGTLIAPLLIRTQSPFFWKPLDYFTLVLEGGFIFAIFSRRSLQAFCAAAVLFHAGTLLMLDLSFAGNVLAYAAFINWATIAGQVSVPPSVREVASPVITWIRRLWGPALAACVLVAGFGYFALIQRAGTPASWLAVKLGGDSYRGPALLLFGLAVPIALIHLGREATSLVKFLSSETAILVKA